MSKPIEYNIETSRYMGPKKPLMPIERSKKQVLPFKVLASKLISLKRAKETDFCFLQDVVRSEQCPEYHGYNTKLAREQGQTVKSKTRSDYLPLIDMKPSDPDTIMTALTTSKVLTTQYGQEYTIFTGDLQLYRVAVNIVWAIPEQFDSVVLRLGGMHLLMSFVGSVGTLMGNSGLEELLESTFAGVTKLLNGKKFPQNVRALRIVTEELLRNTLENFNGYSDLEGYLNDLCSQSRTAKLWVDCLIRPVLLMMMYVRAEREADWPLHLEAVEKMLPYFFAAGHHNYARYGLYYLRSMEAMPEIVRKQFLKGEHVMRLASGVWNAIWSDMYIETTFMRYGHGKKGVIGITLKPETLKVWSLGLHICSRIEEDMRSVCDSESVNDDKRHKEEMKSRIVADKKDKETIRAKLAQSIDPLDPTQHPKNLVNIVTGNIAPESVNVDNSVQVGSSQMKEIEQSWPENFHGTISKKNETMATLKKHIKVSDGKVFDTNLIYTRVIGLQASSREIDINHILNHELAPVPTSMFEDSGDMRIRKTKSLLQVEVSTRHTSSQISCLVIDGSAVLYTIHWPANGTVGDFICNFRTYVGQKLKQGEVYLVFDRYRQYSTKGVTRSGRQSNASKVYQLTHDTPLPPQNVALGVTENKKQIIALICVDLCSDSDFHQMHTMTKRLVITGDNDTPMEMHKGTIASRVDLKTSHEEADIIMIQQLVRSVEDHQGVAVISDDTDVFVLLVHYYAALHLSKICWQPMYSLAVTQWLNTMESARQRQ